MARCSSPTTMGRHSCSRQGASSSCCASIPWMSPPWRRQRSWTADGTSARPPRSLPSATERVRRKPQLYRLAANHPDEQEDDRDHQQDVEPAAERIGGQHSEQPQNDQQDDQKENHVHLRAASLRKQCQEKTRSTLSGVCAPDVCGPFRRNGPEMAVDGLR